MNACGGVMSELSPPWPAPPGGSTAPALPPSPAAVPPLPLALPPCAPVPPPLLPPFPPPALPPLPPDPPFVPSPACPAWGSPPPPGGLSSDPQLAADPTPRTAKHAANVRSLIALSPESSTPEGRPTLLRRAPARQTNRRVRVTSPVLRVAAFSRSRRWDILFGKFQNPSNFGTGDVGFESRSSRRYASMLASRRGRRRRHPAADVRRKAGSALATGARQRLSYDPQLICP
jgi:hypothetical protein